MCSLSKLKGDTVPCGNSKCSNSVEINRLPPFSRDLAPEDDDSEEGEGRIDGGPRLRFEGELSMRGLWLSIPADSGGEAEEPTCEAALPGTIVAEEREGEGEEEEEEEEAVVVGVEEETFRASDWLCGVKGRP